MKAKPTLIECICDEMMRRCEYNPDRFKFTAPSYRPMSLSWNCPKHGEVSVDFRSAPTRIAEYYRPRPLPLPDLDIDDEDNLETRFRGLEFRRKPNPTPPKGRKCPRCGKIIKWGVKGCHADVCRGPLTKRMVRGK